MQYICDCRSVLSYFIGKESVVIKVELSSVIDCPVNEVFDYVVDPTKEPEWQEGVLEAG